LEDNLELELNFTDRTMVESDGVYSVVREKMLSEFPFSDVDVDPKKLKDKKLFESRKDLWVIRTTLTINSKFGIGQMLLNFFGDGKVFIIEYLASVGDVYYNPDISAFSLWCQENGWKIPQPNFDLVKTNKEFWKHFYDTLIVDSDYFDELYGIRPSMEVNNDKK
jgi:hypothetical protein